MYKILRTGSMLIFAGALCAANQPIGMAVADGSFQVDRSRVWGNTTLFDGNVIETAAASSQLRLNGGATVRLAPTSQATIHQRALVLHYGQLESPSGYDVQANSLHVTGATPDAVARVLVGNRRTVLVAAVRGSVRVSNSIGVLVANVDTGKSLSFEPQDAGASAPTRATGCLIQKSGEFVVVEQTANVVLELRGSELEKEVGNRVEIVGIPEKAPASVAGASQVIKVAGLKRVASGGCASVAKKVGGAVAVSATAAGAGAATAGTATAGAAAAGAGAAAAGIGAGTVAVIGGVAAAATAGGLAAAGALPGQSETPPSASR